MILSICSIKINEIILPGHHLHWTSEMDNYAYFEIQGQLEIRWRQRRVCMMPGEHIVGKKFKLFNSGSSVATARGIVFQTDVFKVLNEPIFFRTELERQTCYSLSQCFDQSTPATRLHDDVRILLADVIAAISQSKPSVPPSGDSKNIGRMDPRLIKINRYIRENYRDPLTLPLLAEFIHCNPVYLSNMYTKVFGISPMKYLQGIRMAKARTLLESTDFSISEIANQLGYISSSQFGELFKRYYHTSPSQYRTNYHLMRTMRTVTKTRGEDE